jgi:hypothetical protein
VRKTGPCVLENLEEACMCFSLLRRVGWVAGPGLEGGQVAVLPLTSSSYPHATFAT